MRRPDMRFLATGCLKVLMATSAFAQDRPTDTKLYWGGNTHNTTGYSFVVYLIGTVNSTPDMCRKDDHFL
jgi:hypothetical protein